MLRSVRHCCGWPPFMDSHCRKEKVVGSEASETSATGRTASAHWRAPAASGTSTETGTIAPASVVLAAEGIDAEVDVQHDIAVDGVVLRVRSHRGGDGAAQVALLMEQVIELEHHGERPAFEEALRELHVPDELIGVERVVGIATA